MIKGYKYRLDPTPEQLEKKNLLTQENINKTPVVNREGDVELSAVAGAVKRQNVLV